ncbi:MAG TPA: type II toxin-antitoxin system VapC family toxin [Candidatus Hodarchaeales archaeon]|nr:type II toxin-antitoxin system VapC family toxin [Candidatus Hodarchaeales archaeon]HLC84359.1 type II toxin-antitoxin system VapC family toxin [Candidatus Nanoarchaeia archaeon]
MKFLDSNILAYAFYENPFTERCQKILEQGGMVNTLNIVEALYVLEDQTTREVAQQCMKGLFRSNLTIIDLDVNIVFGAIKNMHRHALNIFDSIHYTCALINDCESFVSFDHDFDGLDLKREEP